MTATLALPGRPRLSVPSAAVSSAILPRCSKPTPATATHDAHHQPHAQPSVVADPPQSAPSTPPGSSPQHDTCLLPLLVSAAPAAVLDALLLTLPGLPSTQERPHPPEVELVRRTRTTRSTTVTHSPRRRRCYLPQSLNASASRAWGLRRAPPPACGGRSSSLALCSSADRAPGRFASSCWQTDPAAPVAHRWSRARDLLTCLTLLSMTARATRAASPRRLHLLHAASASQDHDARESADSQVRSPRDSSRLSPKHTRRQRVCMRSLEEYCRNAARGSLFLISSFPFLPFTARSITFALSTGNPEGDERVESHFHTVPVFTGVTGAVNGMSSHSVEPLPKPIYGTGTGGR
ncbi:hypothetical protein B0H13DRAFT_2672759 [Mycena leptocephala]|nr:hypothetical protein B0H13DRAFT_2672759 [Mycena leptocephala]